MSLPNGPEPPADGAASRTRVVEGGVTPVTRADGQPDPPSIRGYEILDRLGDGGMGVVYRARQVGLNRDVALKVVHHNARPGSHGVLRFLAEAETIAAIRHPNVVEIYDFGDSAGQPYLALEYLPGGTLETRLAAGPLPPREAAALVETLARATHAAHTLGIVHRDLKPGNVLFAADGTPKVTDFGLAKRPAAGVTASVAVMGTPAYMAPEQALGGAKFVGPGADVWALGVILYECLTGRRPFPGDEVDSVMYRVVHEEPPSPRAVAPGLPRDLDLICLKCLEKKAHERYASADQLADDLKRFAAGLPVSVHGLGVGGRALKWARRDPARAVAYGATASVILLVGVASYIYRQKADADFARQVADTATADAQGARRAADDQRKAAETERDRAVKAEAAEKSERDKAVAARESAEADREKAKDATRALLLTRYAQTVDVARRFADLGDAAEAARALDDCPKEFRGWEWGFVRRMAHADRVSFAGHTGRVFAAAASPDGKRVVTGGDDTTARLWAADGTPGPVLRGHTKTVAAVAFSPDGSKVATGGFDGDIRMWDAATGEPGRTIPTGAAVTGVGFSPDGGRILTAGFGGVAKVWSAATGEAVLTVGTPAAGIKAAVFTADGSRIATAGLDGVCRVWDAKTGAERAQMRGRPAVAVAASRDGGRVATVDIDRAVKVWDAAAGTALATIPGVEMRENALALDPAGRRVAAAGADGVTRIRDVATGRELFAAPGPRGEVRVVAFTGGRADLLTADGNRARLWDASTQVGETALSPEQWVALAVSADGRRVFGIAGTRGVQLWDAGGGNAAPVAAGFDAMTAAAFRTDGRHVAVAGVKGKAAATATVFDAATEAVVFETPAGADAVSAVAYSPDGSRLVIGTEGGGLAVRAGDTGEAVHKLEGHPGEVRAVSFTPDGSRFATACAGGVVVVWDAATGKPVAKVKTEGGGFSSVAFHPNGTDLAIATARGVVQVWDAATGKLRHHVGDNREYGCLVAYSPDGSRLATASPAGRVRVWDTAARTDVFTRDLGPAPTASPPDVLAFTADGSKLLVGHRATGIQVWDSAARPPNSPPKPTAPAPRPRD